MLKVVFAGTPAFAVPALLALHRAGHAIVGVYCQPDRPAGRGQRTASGPVKEAALRLGLQVFQPEQLRTAQQLEELAGCKADLMVVAAYGLILPQTVLNLMPHGCWNIHASLLPRWRGAAPIARAIEAGDDLTGVCIMQMEAGLDTGPVLARVATPISPEDTAGGLQERLAQLGADLMVASLARIQAMRTAGAELSAPLTLAPQPSEGVTYAHKIRKEEARIDFGLAAEVLARKMRAFDPYPGCFTSLRTSATTPPALLIKCWRAEVLARETGALPGTITAVDAEGPVIACGRQSLRLLQVQVAGGRRVAASALARQRGLVPGALLG